jgi:ATP adenylyltransferase
MKESNRPLWAPWRIDFIRSEKENYCFLCMDQQKEDDRKNVVFRGKTCFVIMNRYPYNSGHLLIAPYRHISDLDLTTADERAEMMNLTVSVEKTLKKIMNPDAFNIGFNLGTAAGAGVKDHIHMHIVPRWNGDTNFMPVLADVRVVPEAIEATAELIRNSWIP